MKLTTQIARRFLLGGRGSGPSRVTGWVSIVGMAVGSFALVISVAVLNGFESMVQSRIMGFEGDLRITGDLGSLNDPDPDWLQAQSGITGRAPWLRRQAIIIGRDHSPRVVTVKAVDPGARESVYRLGNVDRYESATPGALIGEVLADRLNLQPGDWVTIYSPVDGLARFGAPAQMKIPVSGVFTSKVLDYDDKIVFIPWKTGVKLFSRKTGPDGIDLRLAPDQNGDRIQAELRAASPSGIRIESWADLHENLFHAMRMERIGAMVILSLIIIVAAFNLATTLVLVTFQKIREIGILQTLGMTSGNIHLVLTKQGFFIGGAGMLTGFTLGVALVVLQQIFGLIPLPADIYALTTLPMVLHLRDLILIPLIALVSILAATRLAGKRAMKIEPRIALQMEK
ncbi:MAG: ABC transporter permease [Fidelibacterota bacterium]